MPGLTSSSLKGGSGHARNVGGAYCPREGPLDRQRPQPAPNPAFGSYPGSFSRILGDELAVFRAALETIANSIDTFRDRQCHHMGRNQLGSAPMTEA